MLRTKVTLSSCLLLLMSSMHVMAKKPTTIASCEKLSKKNIDLSFCLDRVKDKADKEMTTWVNNQTFTLEELAKVTGRNASLTIFKRSQSNFLKFREDNCRWQYLQIAPATGASAAFKKCYIQLTNARSAELARLNR